MTGVEEALETIARGEFVLVFDSEERERETDLIKAAVHTVPADIARMRVDGGGLIFLMVAHEIAAKLGLPFLADVFYREGTRFPVLKELIPNDIPYDVKSSFSVPINHRRTFTGITDEDRALTVRRFGELAGDIGDMTPVRAQRAFGEEFRAP
ncbi:MAG TPA: 3,4-dihydroxy-2-butanone-4-phosphate synthase, partial [Thermoplasmata archaeon]|nr:3,4-dihydroxy-2-butanone-4-phosphate synthase [Thermoplasmata archaeon]